MWDTVAVSAVDRHSRCAPRVRYALIVCLCVGLFWFGRMVGAVQKGENIIRADAVVARSFELVDRDGRRAAQLNTNTLGESTLAFFDEKEVLRLRVGFSVRGLSGLTVFDAKKKPRLGLSVNAADGSAIHRTHEQLASWPVNPDRD